MMAWSAVVHRGSIIRLASLSSKRRVDQNSPCVSCITCLSNQVKSTRITRRSHLVRCKTANASTTGASSSFDQDTIFVLCIRVRSSGTQPSDLVCHETCGGQNWFGTEKQTVVWYLANFFKCQKHADLNTWSNYKEIDTGDLHVLR